MAGELLAYCLSMKKLERMSLTVSDPVSIQMYREVCRRRQIRRIPELRQNAGLTTPLLAGLVHTKLYLPATGAGVPYTSGFNTASGVASIVAADEGDEESRVLYNNGDGTWIDENGNLHEE